MRTSELETGLPSSVDAEKMVLGSILLRGSSCFEVIAGIINRPDFSLAKHQTIWGRMDGLHERQSAIDRITLTEELIKYGELESVDGLTYLISLDDGMPFISNVESYAEIVRENASLRRIVLLCQQTMNRAMSRLESSTDIIASLVPGALEIETSGGTPEWQTATDVIREYPGGWQSLVSPAANGNATGIQLPWPRVQQVICGLQKGELIVLAGRPSMGKSAIAMQIAMCAAVQDYGVAYVSLEMTAPALVRREVAQTARVDSVKMKLGYLGPGERARMMESRAMLEQLPIHIESRQSRGRTAVSIMASLRYLSARHPIGLVVIDHMHLVDGPEREERIKFSRIIDAFQRGAKDMHVPFLVLAQLSRKCEEERREPSLVDLKETGSIEQNADVVMFIHRDEMYGHLRDREDLRGIAKLIIGKQRDGQTGVANLIFIKQQTRFESMAEDIEGLQ
jgi:replicative DNA helicase